MKHGNIISALPILAAIGLSGMAHAQTALEEIVVTAQKREQNLNDVGETVAVQSYESMKMRQVVSLEDLAAAIPGLSYSRSAQNTPVFTLRGVGFNEMSLGVYPTVSVYLDEAVLPFPALSAHSAFDLERVEVLKGPQGTLFGQNSTGGAVNYVSAKPTDEFEAGITGTYGRFNLIDIEGYVSGPISETLKGRLAFKYRNADGWQISETRGDSNGSENLLMGRMSLDWEPTENVRVFTSVSSWHDESEAQAMQLSALNVSIRADVQPGVLNAPFPTQDNRHADWSVVDPVTGDTFNRKSDIDSIHAMGRVEVDFNDNLLFTSLSSYIDYDRKSVLDGDGIAAQSLDFRKSNGNVQSFTQEFRLENTNTETYRWIVGVNYEDSQTEEDIFVSYDENSTSNAANNFISVSGLLANNKMNNWAVFANLDYAVSDSINVKGGIRYTNAKFDHTNCNYAPNEALSGLFNILGDIFSGPGTFTPIGVGDCYTLNDALVPGEAFKDVLEQDNISWKVGVDYAMDDDTLFYVNVSQGYKQGSFPSTAASTFVQFTPVVQESVLAFEGGVKMMALEDRLSLNAAAFHYKYTDKQIRGRKDDPIFGVLELLRNIPKSKITGFEADVSVVPFEGFTLRAAGTYISSKVTESPAGAINDLGEITDFTGSRLPFAPNWQLQLDGQYEWMVGELEAFVGFTFNYSSDTMSVLNGDQSPIITDSINRTAVGGELPFVIDSYGVLDLRAGVRTDDGQWSLIVWGKNVTNKYYWTNVLVGDDTLGRLTGRPATYGVTVGYKF